MLICWFRTKQRETSRGNGSGHHQPGTSYRIMISNVTRFLVAASLALTVVPAQREDAPDRAALERRMAESDAAQRHEWMVVMIEKLAAIGRGRHAQNGLREVLQLTGLERMQTQLPVPDAVTRLWPSHL